MRNKINQSANEQEVIKEENERGMAGRVGKYNELMREREQKICA